MAGITVDGFQRKTFQDIITDIETRLKSTESFGPNFDFGVGTPQYFLSSVIANELATLWEVAENTYHSGAIESSEGVSLANNVKFAGISKRQAVKASIINGMQFSGTNGTIIPINFVVSAGDIMFRTTESGTISTGTVVLNVEALIGGISGNVAIGSINFIDQPLIGLTSVTNTIASINGLDTETDEALKVRYLRSLAKGGGSTPDAIRASVLQVSGVTDAVVRNNETLLTVDSVPAKSVGPVILGGDTELIQNAIYDVKAGGIQSFGNLTKDFIDNSGNTITIGISRPTEVDIWVNSVVTSGPDYPGDGDDQVQTAIINRINSLEIGNDVVLFDLLIAVGNSVQGVLNVVLETSTDGTTFLPMDITIAELSKAITDASRVVVS